MNRDMSVACNVVYGFQFPKRCLTNFLLHIWGRLRKLAKGRQLHLDTESNLSSLFDFVFSVFQLIVRDAFRSSSYLAFRAGSREEGMLPSPGWAALVTLPWNCSRYKRAAIDNKTHQKLIQVHDNAVP